MQLLKWIFGIYVCLFLVSCAESDKKRLNHLEHKWEGKEILFPTHSVFTVQGKDTVNFGFKDANYKIVTYIDSVGCMGCKLYLSRWKSFIEKVESVTDKKVAFLFYVHPTKRSEVSSVTRRENFDYPICVDERNDFYNLNHFPLEKYYVSFLLNDENRIIQKGNPAFNPNYQDIYLKLLIN